MVKTSSYKNCWCCWWRYYDINFISSWNGKKQVLSHLNNGDNAVEIKRGIDKAVGEVVEELRTNVSQDITEENQLETSSYYFF